MFNIDENSRYKMSNAFVDSMIKLAKAHKNIVLLHADFGSKFGIEKFSSAFGDRCFNFGLSERNLIGSAIGFALRGKIPFVFGYGNFLGKAFDIIRNGICYPNLNIKLISLSSGFDAGKEGAGYHVFEDIALMNCLPNMNIYCPSDYNSASVVLKEAASNFGPHYIRLSNREMPLIFSENHLFDYKNEILRDGKDICIFSYGNYVYKALKVADILENEGKSVMIVNLNKIKPIQKDLIINSAKSVKLSVSLEEHSLIGGVSDIIANILMEAKINNFKKIGIEDVFTQSGEIDDLENFYGLSVEKICEKIREFLR
ncbi:MAG: transketolase C-terminal domain-containing protein [Candidatus Gracilibacteria bacterium]|jgi:transketolase